MLKEKEHYKKLPSQTAQQILKLVDKNWKSFFRSLENQKKNPERNLGTPQPPQQDQLPLVMNAIIALNHGRN